MTSNQLSLQFESKTDAAAGPFSDRFDDDRQKIDEEIKDLEKSIRALKFRRNMLSPITRLPPELLSKIFIVYAAMYHHTSTKYAYYPSPGPALEWIKVSHICSHWRAVALGCPSLWSTISFLQPKWSEEMLKRSMMASLDIRIDLGYMYMSDPRKTECVNAVLANISRIRSLNIHTNRSMGDILKDLLGPASILESLSLSQSDDHGFTLPKDFLSRGTPSLRRLYLVRCDLMWDSAFLQNLTHMQIHDIQLSYRPTTKQLIAVLQSMPLLELLDLKDALPAFPHEAMPVGSPSTIIDLPRLTLVFVESSVLECTNLFNHISFSPAAILNLRFNGALVTNDSFSSVLTSLTKFISSRMDPIRSITVERLYSHGLVIKAWSNDPAESNWSHSYDDPRSPAAPSLNLSFFWLGLNEEHLATAVCKWLPLAELISLHLTMNDFSVQSWLATFGALDKLQSIYVSSDPARTLVEAMCRNRLNAPQPDRTLPPNLYFRGLQKLFLSEVDFLESAESATFEGLRDALMLRHEEGAEVWSLYLDACIHFDEDDFELLKEIVVDVEWDYMERESSHDEDEEDEEDLDSDTYTFW